MFSAATVLGWLSFGFTLFLNQRGVKQTLQRTRKVVSLMLADFARR
jgi:hypothetical protein